EPPGAAVCEDMFRAIRTTDWRGSCNTFVISSFSFRSPHAEVAMSSVETPIAVGMVAPSFVLHDDAGRPLSSSETRGRPWVLAFARRWTPGHDADAIRAQLRGLGAAPFIVSDARACAFRPDAGAALTAAPS